MSGFIFDVVVVGAGVEGSATAYHLAKQGQNTLLLEQFPLPHTRGSSHGQSRIIRKAYVQPWYANMMHEAYPLWKHLEEESNTKLYKQTGMLAIGEQGSEVISKTQEALITGKSQYDYLNVSQLRRRYPMINFPDKAVGLLDYEAGILHADRCVAKIQEMYQKYGGTLKDGEKVMKIHPGDIVTVETSKGRYRAKSLVLTAGPWAPQMTRDLGLNLPLQPVSVTVTYWGQRTNPSVHSIGKMPTFISLNINSQRYGEEIYGLPANEYPNHMKPVAVSVTYWRVKEGSSNPHTFDNGLPSFSYQINVRGCDAYGMPSSEYPELVKICIHGGAPVDPDSRDDVEEKVYHEGNLVKFVRDFFPGLEDKPSIIEKCMYTLTPDSDFILDTHPRFKNVVIGAGFNGTGFKLAPVVGKVLAQLALGKTPSYDLSPFRMDRFSAKAKL